MTDGVSTKRILAEAEWPAIYERAREALPDAFLDFRYVLNLIGGQWGDPGHGKLFSSPCDGRPLVSYPMVDAATAKRAVRFGAEEHQTWSKVPLDERKRRTAHCLQEIQSHRDLLAYLLVWEIGKPYAQALVSVDRCISGVQWYIDNIDRMLEGRQPLGLISNIASWNYPLSVLVHAMLVQALAGNAVIAKSPTDGGLCALTLALGLARRCGLPVSLVSGSGGQLSEALVRSDEIACLAFVGGRASGRDIAVSLLNRNKRYMLEMEGVNAYGVWDFSDWDELAKQMKKGFEFGKQRCTAYARWVVQRELVPAFLDMYLPVLKSIRVGHPLLVEEGQDTPPQVDFGPLINSRSVEDLEGMYEEAIAKGAIPIFRGKLDESMFRPDQDTSAYMAPAALLNLPHSCALYHKEPFGPVDSVIVVDRMEQLVAEMNVSNGSLVSSIASDDPKIAQRIAGELRGFKVGINKVRSRGDREEPFGGIGESWKGCFVGGEYLVRAVTIGPEGEQLHGNFPDYSLLPQTA